MKKVLYNSCIFHIQKKTLRISRNLWNFGHGRLEIFYIYNSDGISLKRGKFQACQRTFWDIRTQKICICPNGLHEKKETILQKIPVLIKSGFCGSVSFLCVRG